jgi:hypothetical protein
VRSPPATGGRSVAVRLARYKDMGSRVVTDLQIEIEIEINAGTVRVLWWGEANQARTLSAAEAGAQATLNNALADGVAGLHAAGSRLTPAAEETMQCTCWRWVMKTEALGDASIRDKGDFLRLPTNVCNPVHSSMLKWGFSDNSEDD